MLASQSCIVRKDLRVLMGRREAIISPSTKAARSKPGHIDLGPTLSNRTL